MLALINCRLSRKFDFFPNFASRKPSPCYQPQKLISKTHPSHIDSTRTRRRLEIRNMIFKIKRSHINSRENSKLETFFVNLFHSENKEITCWIILTLCYKLCWIIVIVFRGICVEYMEIEKGLTISMFPVFLKVIFNKTFYNVNGKW